MFISKFQGTYERSSTTETLKTINQKHDESLQDYVKHFGNAMNAIPNIHDIRLSMPSVTGSLTSRLSRRSL
jgi:hypothetical protein